ncbi:MULTISPECIES: sugar-binding transcriptional regulator [unclassified Paenibacillus]|uniref:sugar-binding transcriptional regulator n=1 Tax=unclassified Paenibacillus TaxID=185978 RepID=UPI00095648F4|nr:MULTISPECIES: sugar-binding transcriptional regulator [unclassified Paenibacillus]ASS66401.1 sugar-binding transcriptional regulator [Paenibacillus sp. RUD330]SIQ05430.1 deoxyribonucleoside regulator [Paenibacillus sp. RU4X]SIQ25580.1 deoxyribonucleoside regulator [Paenibacillus sp. RU4T]
MSEKIEKMVEAARLYYQMDYSQQDIARLLGVSRPTVSRFLQQAKTEGIVQITIHDPQENHDRICRRLEEQFGLDRVIVVSTPSHDDAVVKKYIGEAAAAHLYEIVKAGDTIAVTWGTTLYEVAQRLPMKSVKDVRVVQLNGGLSYSETNTYASEIVHLFGGAFNTPPHLLPLPAIVDEPVVRRAIEADRHISKILEIGREANIAVFTVGVPTVDSVLVQAQYLRPEELETVHRAGKGDICSRFIDIDGDICNEELDARTIGIRLEELRSKEHSILVAGGIKKVEAMYAAMRGGYPNTVVTDSFTARQLLEIVG